MGNTTVRIQGAGALDIIEGCFPQCYSNGASRSRISFTADRPRGGRSHALAGSSIPHLIFMELPTIIPAVGRINMSFRNDSDEQLSGMTPRLVDR